jgi:hypothetical protein
MLDPILQAGHDSPFPREGLDIGPRDEQAMTLPPRRQATRPHPSPNRLWMTPDKRGRPSHVEQIIVIDMPRTNHVTILQHVHQLL